MAEREGERGQKRERKMEGRRRIAKVEEGETIEVGGERR